LLQSHEMVRKGPYLRVTLPDVSPPDWGALLRDLRIELDEGVERATVITPRFESSTVALETFLRLASVLGRQGVAVQFEQRNDVLKPASRP
jgi:hypothetical protein